MIYDRVTITVSIDRDGLPGAFHTAEDCARRVQSMLDYSIPHYHPSAVLVDRGEDWIQTLPYAYMTVEQLRDAYGRFYDNSRQYSGATLDDYWDAYSENCAEISDILDKRRKGILTPLPPDPFTCFVCDRTQEQSELAGYLVVVDQEPYCTDCKRQYPDWLY